MNISKEYTFLPGFNQIPILCRTGTILNHLVNAINFEFVFYHQIKVQVNMGII
jgi:hypothetical protein